MKLINSTLLNPHDILLISAIAIIVNFIAMPTITKIVNKGL